MRGRPFALPAASSLVMLLAVPAFAVPEGGAAPPPPGGPTAVVACAACHDQPAAWSKKAAVHPPVTSGDCLACHNAHASRHGSLLKSAPARVCLHCHKDLAGRIQTAPPDRVHGALTTEKQCLACHEPHASDRRKLLSEDLARLCGTCHDATFKDAQVAHQHPPFADGDCLSCHDPHVSPRPGLAVADQPPLCTSCHSLPDPKLAAAHRKISIAEAQCTACHAPHGSGAKAMIRKTSHPPFADGSCDTCHTDPKEPPASLKREAEGLCATCHDLWKTGHQIPKEASCLACHDPHASAGASLIAGRERLVCLSCHTDIASQRAAAAAYHPVTGATSDCTTCHELHKGSGGSLLRRKSPQETCGTCHASHAEFSHPMGEGVADPSHPGQSVTCLSCHDPHGTPFPQFLLADPRQDLCVRCHQKDAH